MKKIIFHKRFKIQIIQALCIVCGIIGGVKVRADFGPPENVRLEEIGSGSVTITWASGGSEVTKYYVSILQEEDLIFKEFSSNTLSCELSNLLPNHAYTFGVCSVKDSNSPPSIWVNVTGKTKDLYDPTELSVNFEDYNKVAIRWRHSLNYFRKTHDFLGYRVYIDDQLIEEITKTLPSDDDEVLLQELLYSIVELSYNNNYVFKVTSFDGSNNESSGIQLSKTYQFGSPIYVRPGTRTQNSIEIVWDKYGGGVAGHLIRFKKTWDSSGFSTWREAQDEHYIISCSPYQRYLFEIKAYDCEMNFSSVVEYELTSLPSAPTTPPINFRVDSVSANSISFRWDIPSGDDLSYKLYQDGEYIKLTSTHSITYSNSSLDRSTVHEYTVKACNSSGISDDSNIITGSLDSFDIVPPDVSNLSLSYSSTNNSITGTFSGITDNVGVVSYKIFRDNIEIANTTDASFEDINLQINTGYAYHIQAFDGHDPANQSTSAQITAYTQTYPPRNLIVASVASETVSFSWTLPENLTGITGYKLYRNGIAVLNISDASATSASLTGVSNSTIYSYYLKSYSENSSSLASNTIEGSIISWDDQLPIPPTLRCAERRQNSISLAWDNEGDLDNVGVSQFKIYRDNQLIGTVSGTTFYDSGLEACVTYHYKVYSIDLSGNQSASSADLDVTTIDETAPSTPSNLKLMATHNTVVLSWEAAMDNIGVTGYRILRGGAEIATIASGMTYTDSGLNPLASYSYTVKAYDAAGNYSESVSSTIQTARETAVRFHLELDDELWDEITNDLANSESWGPETCVLNGASSPETVFAPSQLKGGTALKYASYAPLTTYIQGGNLNLDRRFVFETRVRKGSETAGAINLIWSRDSNLLKWWIDSDGLMRISLDGGENFNVTSEQPVLSNNEWTFLSVIVDLKANTLNDIVKMYKNNTLVPNRSDSVLATPFTNGDTYMNWSGMELDFIKRGVYSSFSTDFIRISSLGYETVFIASNLYSGKNYGSINANCQASGLSIRNTTAVSTEVRWEYSTDMIEPTGFAVFRRNLDDANSQDFEIGRMTWPEMGFADENLSPLTNYRYTVKAYYDADGEDGEGISIDMRTFRQETVYYHLEFNDKWWDETTDLYVNTGTFGTPDAHLQTWNCNNVVFVPSSLAGGTALHFKSQANMSTYIKACELDMDQRFALQTRLKLNDALQAVELAWTEGNNMLSWNLDGEGKMRLTLAGGDAFDVTTSAAVVKPDEWTWLMVIFDPRQTGMNGMVKMYYRGEEDGAFVQASLSSASVFLAPYVTNEVIHDWSGASMKLFKRSVNAGLSVDFVRLTSIGYQKDFGTEDTYGGDVSDDVDSDSSLSILINPDRMLRRVVNPPADFNQGQPLNGVTVAYDNHPDAPSVFHGVFQIEFALDAKHFDGSFHIDIYLKKPEDNNPDDPSAGFKKIAEMPVTFENPENETALVKRYYWNSRIPAFEWTAVDAAPYWTEQAIHLKFEVR